MINKHIDLVRIDLIIIAIFLQSFSFVTIKYASMYNSYSYLLLFLAFSFIVSRAYIWQIILKNNELSKVYPFNSLVQVLILVCAYYLFSEDIKINNLIGLLFMVIGLFILGKK